MAYEAFTVLRRATGEKVGSVMAQDAAEAVYRLAGGEYGRPDLVALCGDDRPLAVEGLTSYRYKGRYGFVMIGASDKADALQSAARSVSGEIDPEKLEIWSANALRYVKA